MAAQPPARFGGALFTTRFGRRIFVMFCLAALVPAAAVYWMTYQASSSDLGEIADESLQTLNKSYALGVFQRLQTAQQALAEAGQDMPAGDGRPATLGVFFSEVDVLPAQTGRGDKGKPTLRSELRKVMVGLAATAVVLPSTASNGDHGVAVLARAASGDGRVLAGRLRPDYLWGVPEELGGSVRICAFAGARPLFCGGGLSAASADGRIESEWSLFLKPTFEADSWRFVASKTAPDVLATFPRIVVPMMAGVLLLALLLSSLHIRRVLGPLDALLGRIRAFGGGASPSTAGVTGDEFGMLTHTFDELGSRIGRQMDTLNTLSEVDRLILARVPFAGVVELVTSRIREVVPDATVGVLLVGVDAAGHGEWHERARTSAGVEVLSIDGHQVSPTSVWPASTPGGDVVALHAIGPGVPCDRLAGFGDTHAFLLALGGGRQAGVWLVLGFPHVPDMSPELRAQVVDLAERIAVAAAFQAHEQRLVHQARHDLLTGLPNRLATFEALGAASAAAAFSRARFAVVFLDLDRFKAINDGLGHGVGDDILVQSGQRIRASLAPGDFVGRFGGDEFFLILPDASEPAAVTATLDRVVAAFKHPLAVAQREFVQHFSAGIAFHPDDGVDAAVLIRNADVAMYRAKKSGGARAAFFEQAMNEDAQARLQMEVDLRLAIERRDIRVHYQPRVDSRTGYIVGAEALARWTHPRDGAIPPQVFIALAEECGLIDALGRLMLDEACRQMAQWSQAGLDLAMVGINISGHQLQSGRLLDDVQAAMQRWDIAPSSLELEVTETILVQDSQSGGTQLQALRDRGLSIAIDDFGTGYSSLAYLTRLPSDTLKIDRAFVVDLLDGDATVEAVVRSIIAIARDLGKHTVAEGVESMAQVERLAEWGCYVIQGYVYSKSLSADAMTRLLGDQRGLVPTAQPPAAGGIATHVA